MIISIISFTRAGLELSKKIYNKITSEEPAYRVDLYLKCEALKDEACKAQDKTGRETFYITYVNEGIDIWAGKRFTEKSALIFIGSTGIAVRAVAGAVDNKLTDSPVVVIDENGEYVISLLSGHMGGANELSRRLADLIGAVPVITTATDKKKVWAADIFAKKNKLNIINKDSIKTVNSKSLEKKKITLILPENSGTDMVYEKEAFEIIYMDLIKDNEVLSFADTLAKNADVVVLNNSYKNEKSIFESIDNRSDNNPLILAPKEYVIGIGCKKGKTFLEIENAVNDVLEKNDLSINQIAYIASIDIKKDEPGIIEFAEKNRIEFVTFSPDELEKADGEYDESKFVKEKTGVGNVCERAAVRACTYGGRLIWKKSIYDGITIAVAKRKWKPEIKL
ncbi:MAG: cobalamin biosynthesis protein [Lachnospiraceae bacterium]|nr:cobalamin biosynthesis protein [Lachnospiraceae bacterium]